ncbi:MAG: hypothetical protein KGL39_31960 [Patescibacteria group bacterium]|nr:hypothetical protein [Patescibacteria group bacterium]
MKPENRQFARPKPTEGFRVPPQDQDAEISVLGSMFLSKEACFTAFEILEGKEFYREANRKLFECMFRLHESQIKIDVITLADELKRMEAFENVGGVSGLTALLERTPSAANCESYCVIVREKFLARQLITATMNITADAYADMMPVKELLDSAIDRVMDAVGGEIKKISDDPEEMVSRIQHRLEMIDRGKHKPMVSSGIERVDKVFGGIDGNGVTSVVGPTKIGKSIILQTVALNNASGRTKIPWGYAIPDKPKELFETRFACAAAGIDMRLWNQTDKLLLSDDRRLAAYSKLSKSAIHLVGQEDIGRDIKHFGNWVMRAKNKWGIQGVVLDSATNLQVPKSWGETDEKKESEKVYYLMELCQKAKVAMLAVVEMANKTEANKDSSHFGRSKGTASWKYQPLAAWGVYKSEIEGHLKLRLEASNSSPADLEVNLEVDFPKYRVVA